MKHVCILLLVFVSASLLACWGTVENYDKNFIYSINNYVRINLATMTYPPSFADGGTVAFPATVSVKINPLDTGNPITKAVLQYRIGDTGEYTTAVSINNPKWDLTSEKPRPLFGPNTIKITPVPAAGTRVYIRMYLSDGIYETFNLEENDSELGAFTCYVTSNGRAVPQLIAMNALIADTNGMEHSIPLASLLFTNEQELK